MILDVDCRGCDLLLCQIMSCNTRGALKAKYMKLRGNGWDFGRSNERTTQIFGYMYEIVFIDTKMFVWLGLGLRLGCSKKGQG